MNEPAECIKGEPAKNMEEVRAIVLAEYRYWSTAPENVQMQAMGAIGAAANILAAINGFRAPWHPKEDSMLDELQQAMRALKPQ
jgi:hypothetical protein